MKEEREILSGIDAPLKKRQGGAHNGPPPPGKLGLRVRGDGCINTQYIEIIIQDANITDHFFF